MKKVLFYRKLLPDIFLRFLVRQIVYAKTDHVSFGRKVRIDLNTKFEGFNFINNYCTLRNSYIGRGTYISGKSTFVRAKIGRFCSIGQNVRNYFGLHPAKQFVSTHPSFYSIKKQAGFTFVTENKFEEHQYIDSEKKFLIKIGNDVWIGNNVSIMDGVSIGDGAIIAFGAVVTKNIEPYSIVGGIPAKHIKYRFTKEQIDILKTLKWWDKDLDWLNENVASFVSINRFIRTIR